MGMYLYRNTTDIKQVEIKESKTFVSDRLNCGRIEYVCKPYPNGEIDQWSKAKITRTRKAFESKSLTVPRYVINAKSWNDTSEGRDDVEYHEVIDTKYKLGIAFGDYIFGEVIGHIRKEENRYYFYESKAPKKPQINALTGEVCYD